MAIQLTNPFTNFSNTLFGRGLDYLKRKFTPGQPAIPSQGQGVGRGSTTPAILPPESTSFRNLGVTSRPATPSPIVYGPSTPYRPPLSSIPAPNVSTPQGPRYAAPTPAPNASTPFGPRYFAPPVLPQIQPRVESIPEPRPTAAPIAPISPDFATSSTTSTQASQAPSGAPSAPTEAPPAPRGPEAPAVPPDADESTRKAVSEAEAAYQKSLQISPEELSSQADIDKLIEATKKAYRSTQDQPIALEFITGELASLERRATGLAEPLERKLARLQAARTASSEASKFALERLDKKSEVARTEAKDIRTEAESARRFGFEQKGRESTQSLQEKTFDLTQRKFNEDVRQFGITSAQKNREIAIDEAKAAAEKAGKTDASAMLSNVQLVNDIIGNAGAISGPIQTGSIPFTAGSTTKNQYEQLKGILALDKRTLLKGSGQISDYESRVLDRAASDLGRNQTESDFKKSLQKVRGVFTTAAGLEADVKVTSPSGEVIVSTATRAEIDQLIREGNKVDYQ